MSERDDTRRREEPSEEPLPRDPQDQQATDDHDDDPLEITVPPEDRQDEDLPDTDEAGTGPKGRRRTATIHPEHPEPDEPTG
ncbi:hypothetical protein ACFVIM_34630 [Streptomyces sp. NPDC057638]|uniref:hypothetical protein n=1 Tax=Streptomyces sp. NPDC057638 TaxID=3346190 RepID=UPI00368F9701